MGRWKDFADMLIRKLKLRGQAGRFPTVHVPAAAALVLVAFAPSVAATAPQVVTPPTKALTITKYAPVVTAGSQSLTVTPGTKALTITRRVPTVTVPAPQLVTPTTRALTITRYAPTVAASNALTVTPTTRALTVTRFAPTITASNKQRVTPPTKALALNRFAPTVTASGSGPKLVVPTTKAVVVTRYAPTVTAAANRLLIPGKATRTITRYAPTIFVGNIAAFYISPTGNNTTGAGTQASPWKTIQKFIDSAPSAGDTLYCRGGTYSSSGTSYAGFAGHPALPGTSGNPITIRNYPGETPVYDGLIQFRASCTYVVIDGLQFVTAPTTGTGTIYAGDPSPAAYSTHHITIRNCKITHSGTFPDALAHGIYLSSYVSDITIEYNEIVGPGVGNRSGFGVHLYHSPGPLNVLVQRNIIRNWLNPNGGGLTFADSVSTGSILHNTFADNNVNIMLYDYATLTIRDNAGEDAVGSEINDQPGRAIKDHNYWAQTLTAGYKLTAGSLAINGASDGTDAGALDYP